MKKNRKFWLVISIFLILILVVSLYFLWNSYPNVVIVRHLVFASALFVLVICGLLFYDMKVRPILDEKAESQFLADEEINRTYDITGQLVARYDIKKDALFLPRNYAEKYGLPAVTHNFHDEIANLFKDVTDKEGTEARQDFFRRIRSGESEGSVDMLYSWKDAKPEWHRLTFTTIFKDDKPVRAVITARIVNEEHEREENYNRLVKETCEPSETESSGHAILDVTDDRLETCSSFNDKFDDSLAGMNIKGFYRACYADVCFNIRGKRYSDVFSKEKMLGYFNNGDVCFDEDYKCENENGAEWVHIDMKLASNPFDGHVMAFLKFRDITNEKKTQLEEAGRSELDGLTGVYNRYTVNRLMNEEFDKSGGTGAVIYVEIIDLKNINTFIGIDEGDRVIKIVADCLSGSFGRKLTGRVSGDRFAVFVPNATDGNEQKEKLTEILNDISNIRPAGNGSFRVSFNAGIAVSFEGSSINMLKKQADLALYSAKKDEKENIVIYKSGLMSYRLTDADGSIAGCDADELSPACMEYVKWLAFENRVEYSETKELYPATDDPERMARRQNLEMRCLALNSRFDDDAARYVEEVLHTVVDYYGAEKAHVGTFAKEIPYVSVNYNEDAPTDILKAAANLSLTSEEASASNTLIWMPDSETAAETNPDVYRYMTENGIKNVAAVAITRGGRFYGYLTARNLTCNTDDIFLLCIISEMLKIKVDQCVAHEQNMFDRYYDSLTGYLNFEGFVKAAGKITAEAVSAGEDIRYAILFTDIRRLKQINDAFGFDAGNKIIREWADLFDREQKEGETFCRVSADQFCALKHFKDPAELRECIEHMADAINIYLETEYETMYEITPVCGACIIDDLKNFDIEDAINRANIAQKECKKLAGRQFAIFDEKLHETLMENMKIETEANDALERGEFIAYFQPKVRINDRDGDPVIHAEALARWIKNGQIYRSPGTFIPLFEANGRITDLDIRIFTESCRAIRAFREKGIRLCISVNLSRITLLKPDALEQYDIIRRNFGVEPSELEIEFTESIAVSDFDTLMSALRFFKDRGYLCSMDDFGSFYSSLNMLQKLPLDILKIDQKFFHESDNIDRQRAVVRNVLNMAKDLGMCTVAEGVEEKEQVRFLEQSGCEFIQGFYFSKPLAEEDFYEWSLHEGENYLRQCR